MIDLGSQERPLHAARKHYFERLSGGHPPAVMLRIRSGGRVFIGCDYHCEEEEQHVPIVDVDALVAACVRRRLDRDLLLSWVSDAVRGQLPRHRTDAGQYRSDIEHLMQHPDALGKWLRQGERLAGPYAEAQVFKNALRSISAGPSVEQQQCDDLRRVIELRDIETIVRMLLPCIRRPGWRTAALADLPPGFAMSLNVVSRPVDQLRFDLMNLNREPRLVGLQWPPMGVYLRSMAGLFAEGERSQFCTAVMSAARYKRPAQGDLRGDGPTGKGAT